MAGPLVLDCHAIEALCRKYAVRRLLLFGSAGTDHFDEALENPYFAESVASTSRELYAA